jgi:hypothetical protein
MIELEHDAPDLEDLAAYLDGRLSGERRSSVEERLLRDEDYYEVYLETASYLQEQGPADAVESGKVVTPAAWWQSWRVIAPLAVAATVVLAVGVWRLTVGPPTEVWVARLDPAQIVEQEGWKDPGWARLRGNNVSQGYYRSEELAFRIGLRTVDLRVALAARNRVAATTLVAMLEQMTGAADLFVANAAYQDLLDQVGAADFDDLFEQTTEIEELLDESIESGSPEARSFALGAWTEAGRLAALSGNADVLAGVFGNRREAQKIDKITTFLKDVESVVEAEPGAQDFDAAEAAFEKIARALAGRG